MQIKKGYNRIVFVFPKFGIVIKFSRIFLLLFIRSLFKRTPGGKWCEIKRQLSYSPEVYCSWSRMLFKGIKDNWNEFYFYQQTKHVAVEPTYFSIFGFINIQRYGESEKIDFRALGKIITQIIGQEALMYDGHHFTNSDNFSFRGNKFRFRDYGSFKTQCIIDDYGLKIFDEMSIQQLREEHTRVKQKPLME